MSGANDRTTKVRFVGLCLVAMLGLAACAGPTSTSEADSAQARQLAQDLQSKLQTAGLPVPSEQVLTALYGKDGGVSCENANDLQQRLGQFMFGSPAIGRRVAIDPTVIEYDVAVISTYCPDVLARYQSGVANLKTAATIPTQ